MENNSEINLKILMSDKTISETLSKILSGQYVSCKERKEGMKAVIDRWADVRKNNIMFEQDKQMIDAQAQAMKTWIDNLPEEN